MGKIISKKDLFNINHGNSKVGVMCGVFDMFHVGHNQFIENAKKFCDILIVYLMSDKVIRGYKGEDRPIIKQADRAKIISSLSNVDYVIVSDIVVFEIGNISKIRPDIVFFTKDVGLKKINKIRENKIKKKFPKTEIKFLSYHKNTSTTKIINLINSGKKSIGSIREENIVNKLNELSQKSTCILRNVACIIVKNGKILSEGYNTSLDGKKCTKDDCLRVNLLTQNEFGKGKQLEVTRAIHAEQLAISNAAKNGTSLNGSTIYSTHLPCIICARLIVKSGIKEFHYLEEYSNKEGLELLIEYGVKVSKI